MRLKDKVAIVTGAAHGMGEAEARLFAKEGARVVVADILQEQAEAVAADIRAGGGDATAATIDVTSEPDWLALIDKTVATYGRLDILVNNAGISGSSVGDPDGLDGLGPHHRGQPDERLSRHQARRRADGEDRRRLDRQYQLDHGVRRRRQRPSRLPRLERRGADLLEGRGGALWPHGGSRQHGASRLHAADAERDQRRTSAPTRSRRPRCAGSASRSRSPMACCSLPRTRRRSSPAPNWSSTAALSPSRRSDSGAAMPHIVSGA